MRYRKIRVFLVDDHELIRRGLRDCMEAEEDLVVVGEAGTAGEAARLIPAIMPEVVVLDVRLPDGNGIEVCRDLRSLYSEIRFLILTTFSDDEALFDAIVTGADGYVLKDTRGDNLIESIRRVAEGQSLLDPAVTKHVLARLRRGKARTRGRSLLLDNCPRYRLRLLASAARCRHGDGDHRKPEAEQ